MKILHLNTIFMQACSGDEDGMLGFDLHSDGQGQRWEAQLMKLMYLDSGSLCFWQITFWLHFRHLHAAAKDDETKITSNINGAPAFSPKKSSYSCIQMNGKEVFRFAVRCVPQSIEAALEDAGLTSSGIDWLLLHQVVMLPFYWLHLKCRQESWV